MSQVHSPEPRARAVAPLAPGHRVEPLERRVLLDGAAEAWVSDAPALAGADVATVRWEGQSVVARPGRWVLRLDAVSAGPAGKGAAGRVAAVQRLVASRRSDVRVLKDLGLSGLSLIEAPTDLAYGPLLRSLQNLPGFRYLEPDVAFTLDATPSDPRYVQMWQLNNTGQTGGAPDADIDAPEAWSATETGSAEVVVGVLDSGILYDHPDLAARMWRNPGETPGNGADDDGNGWVDDVYGADFANGDGDPRDDRSHGTHVAGTIAAAAGNGVGVAGVAWNARLMALKVSDEDGVLDLADAVAGLNYAIDMRRRGVNIRAVNGSWSGFTFTQSLRDAIDAAGREGILYSASAGNLGWDNDEQPSYPTGYRLPNLVSVAATDESDAMAWFSSYGRETVGLAAPGVRIASTVPVSEHPSGYQRFNGTSMAAPHVAAVAALAWGVRPAATVAQVKEALLSGTDPLPALAGKTVSGGRLNALGTLRRLGLFVVDSATPAEGDALRSAPTEFTLRFGQPADPATVQAADLSVGGRPADSVSLSADGRAATFRFSTPPVTAEGPTEARVARGALARAGDGEPLAGYRSRVYYDSFPAPATLTPPDGSPVNTPFTSIDVRFDEPYDPATLGGLEDLLLDRGNVVGFTPLTPTTVRYTLANLVIEGPVTAFLLAGSVTDARGNPMGGATARYEVDIDTVPFANEPVGEPDFTWIRSDRRKAEGRIGFAGDTDSFTLQVAPRQVITVRVSPSADLRPTVALRGPSGELLRMAQAPSAGQFAAVAPVGGGEGGTFTVTVAAAAAGNVGDPPLTYTLQVWTNVSPESEHLGGAPNNTRATAEDLDPHFLPLAVEGAGWVGARAAILGRADPSGADALNQRGSIDLEPNNNPAEAYSLAAGFAAVTGPQRFQLAVRGFVGAGGDRDWFDLGPLRPGDALTASVSGLPSSRGTLADPKVALYRHNNGQPLLVGSDDNSGAGADALLSFTIAEADTYLLVAEGAGGATGSYDLGLWLQAAGAAPRTDGPEGDETEPNDSAAAADDLAGSWRAVRYVTHAGGHSLDNAPDWSNGTPDFFSFQFTAGDLVTVGPAMADARVVLRGPDSAVLARKPLDDAPALPLNSVYGYRIPVTGTYYLEVKGGTEAVPPDFGPWYRIPVYLSTNSPPPAGPWEGVDWYRFPTSVGQRFSVTLLNTEAGGAIKQVDLRIEDEAGREVQLTQNLYAWEFTSSSGGPYYARVSGADTRYVLVVNTDRVPGPRVVARQVFYSGSPADADGHARSGAGDDAAIAMDKRALGPGETVTSAHHTSYARGVNGVMVDFSSLPGNGNVAAGDFDLRIGNVGDPSTWPASPAPSSVTVRRGAGTGGSDRVTITWPDGAIRNQWLRVTVKANANTGLTAPDVFFFGNLAGDANGDRAVNGSDFAVLAAGFGKSTGMSFATGDFNGDSAVNGSDFAVLASAFGKTLPAVQGAAPVGLALAPPAAVTTGAPAIARRPAATEAARRRVLSPRVVRGVGRSDRPGT